MMILLKLDSKIQFRSTNISSKYEDLSYQYDATERAWKRAAKPIFEKDKMKEINKNPSNSGYIYAANQNVKDLYYRTKGIAYDQKLMRLKIKSFRSDVDKFPADKSPKKFFMNQRNIYLLKCS